jgi:hypothetical protein
MFDYVKVSLDKLPLTDEEKALLPKDRFQTKDFDCMLNEIRINDDGTLENDFFWNGRVDTLDLTGSFNFYTINTKDDWVEFQAYFTDGKLDVITQV